MGFTKQQRAFIAAYCANPELGQAEAARRAGVGKRAKVTASEWMHDEEVRGEIERQLANKYDSPAGEITPKKQLTVESVLEDLDALAEMCKKNGAGAWQAATLLKVAELKGKYLKMFTDRVEFDLSDKLIAKLEAGRRNAGIKQLPTASAEVVEEPESNEPEKPESIQ